MNMQTWIQKNTHSLAGKCAVITGATGGLGSAACRYLLSRDCEICMVIRDAQKGEALKQQLLQQFPQANIQYFLADLEDISSVSAVCDKLSDRPINILLLNAGTYAIPREICSTGYDKVFETNFLSHYYMVHRLLPTLRKSHGKVVAVGSIAHRFVTLDTEDPDYAKHEGDEKIYGNSKRFLMYALMELLKEEPDVSFAIGHPGISFTGITSHYPKNILPFVRFSMKLLFMWPDHAVRSIVKAVFSEAPYLHWFGPRFFDIWGDPAMKALDSCDEQERKAIFTLAEQMVTPLLKS